MTLTCRIPMHSVEAGRALFICTVRDPTVRI